MMTPDNFADMVNRSMAEMRTAMSETASRLEAEFRRVADSTGVDDKAFEKMRDGNDQVRELMEALRAEAVDAASQMSDNMGEMLAEFRRFLEAAVPGLSTLGDDGAESGTAAAVATAAAATGAATKAAPAKKSSAKKSAKKASAKKAAKKSAKKASAKKAAKKSTKKASAKKAAKKSTKKASTKKAAKKSTKKAAKKSTKKASAKKAAKKSAKKASAKKAAKKSS